MSESLNIDMAAMLNQMTPEMRALMLDILQKGQAAVAEKTALPEPCDKDYSSLEKRDVSCITSKEDFFDERMYVKVYRGLYEDIAGGVVARCDIPTVEYLLSEKAKEIGKTDLQKLFKSKASAYKKRMKQEFEQAKRAQNQALRDAAEEERRQQKENGNLTQYMELPEWCTGNKYIGEGWIANNDEGIYKLEERGSTIRKVEACGRAAMVNRLLAPMDGGDGIVRVELAYDSEDGWRHRIVERGELVNQNRAIGLAEYGVDVNSERVRPFTNAMTSMLKESSVRGAIPKVPSSQKLALYKDGRLILPYASKDFIFEKENEFPQMMEALTPHGDAEKSRQGFVELRKKNIFKGFNFAIAATLAAPIIMMTDANGFVFNLYAPTGSGKSLVQAIIATLWGDFHMNKGFVRGADNTPTNLETVAGIMNCLPLIVDDYNKLQTEDDKRKFNKNVMLLAGGIGKGRATKNLSIRETASYGLDVFITGEQSIGEIAARTGAGGGVINRLYEVPTDAECPVSKAEIDEIMETFNDNYGHLGVEFVGILNRLKAKGLKAKVSEKARELEARMKELGVDKTNKQIDIAAILLVADEIAAEEIFKDNRKISLDEAIEYMADSSMVKQEARMYQAVIDKVYSNPTRFEGLAPDAMLCGEIWGKYEKTDEKEAMVEETGPDGQTIEYAPTTVAIFKKNLTEMAKECNASVNMFLAYLKREGLLYPDKDRPDKKVPFKHYSNFEEKENDIVTRLRAIKFRLPRQDDIPFDEE